MIEVDDGQIVLLTGDRYKAWHAWALNNFEAVLYYKLKLAAVGSGASADDADGSLAGAEGGDLVSNGSSVASPPG